MNHGHKISSEGLENLGNLVNEHGVKILVFYFIILWTLLISVDIVITILRES